MFAETRANEGETKVRQGHRGETREEEGENENGKGMGLKGGKRGRDGWWGRVLFTTLVQLVGDSAEGSSGRARAFSKNQ